MSCVSYEPQGVEVIQEIFLWPRLPQAGLIENRPSGRPAGGAPTRGGSFAATLCNSAQRAAAKRRKA
jgi:hypothetical protein